MTETTEHTIDRTGWPAGPWDAEPEDRAEWRYKGLPCLIVRNDMGSWCGYVGVPDGHPWHGQGYGDDALAGVEVHWGLTFSDRCSPGGRICHTPAPDEADDVWWLGFDCGHCDDAQPAVMAALIQHGRDALSRLWVYRDRAFVEAQVRGLADQVLAAVSAKK